MSIEVEVEALRYLNILYKTTPDEVALSYIFNIIETANAQRNLLLLDAILLNFSPNKVSPCIATGVVRATNGVKLKLTAWKTCLSRIKRQFKLNGLDANQLLRGLL